MKKLLLVLLCAALLGCAHSSRTINRVSLGMTKAEVIQVMGEPTSTGATQGVEYLHYLLAEALVVDNFTPYYVRLRDGKVDAYGRLGDFDSTKVPEEKKTIDLNIKH